MSRVYLVADYNPKYLDGAIKSVIARLLHNVRSEIDGIEDFNVEVEDKVEGLSQNSAKAILNAEVESDLESVELIDKLNGELRMQISSQSVYSITASSTQSAQKYEH